MSHRVFLLRGTGRLALSRLRPEAPVKIARSTRMGTWTGPRTRTRTRTRARACSPIITAVASAAAISAAPGAANRLDQHPDDCQLFRHLLLQLPQPHAEPRLDRGGITARDIKGRAFPQPGKPTLERPLRSHPRCPPTGRCCHRSAAPPTAEPTYLRRV